MTPYYSIISAAIRPTIQERITVALLVITQNAVYFGSSKNKLNAVKGLIAPHLYAYLTDTLSQISTMVENETKQREGLFASQIQNNAFSMSYLDYANRYHNTLVQFSEPIEIDRLGNEDLFVFLFNKYIDPIGLNAKIKTIKSIEKAKEAFIPTIKEFYTTDKKITSNELKDLIIPIKVDMIGKNDIPVIAQFIDFESPLHYIRHDLGSITMLTQAYQSKCKTYLIGNEPDKSVYAESHQTWDNIRDRSGIEFVPIDEIQKVKEYAVEHGVKPLYSN